MFKKDVKQDPKAHILVSKIGSFQLERGTIYERHNWEKRGQTHPWVVPLGTLHPKFLKPIQLQNNMRLI
jgi:hypothetical protein